MSLYRYNKRCVLSYHTAIFYFQFYQSFVEYTVDSLFQTQSDQKFGLKKYETKGVEMQGIYKQSNQYYSLFSLT